MLADPLPIRLDRKKKPARGGLKVSLQEKIRGRGRAAPDTLARCNHHAGRGIFTNTTGPVRRALSDQRHPPRSASSAARIRGSFMGASFGWWCATSSKSQRLRNERSVVGRQICASIVCDRNMRAYIELIDMAASG